VCVVEEWFSIFMAKMVAWIKPMDFGAHVRRSLRRRSSSSPVVTAVRVVNALMAKAGGGVVKPHLST
jgi:hypothetical protein